MKYFEKIKIFILSKFFTLNVIAVVSGLLIAFCGLAAVAFIISNDWLAAKKASEKQVKILASVLEDQINRVFDSTEIALATLAKQSVAYKNSDQYPDNLQQILRSFPFIRSLAVLDSSGNVLVSSQSHEKGLVIDLERLGIPSYISEEKAYVGKLVFGRGLASASRVREKSSELRQVAFIPVFYVFEEGNGNNKILVALINADSFSNFQHVALESVGYEATIVDFEGHVFASSDIEHLPALLERGLRSIPIFTKFLPKKEQATYIGAGAISHNSIVAFRALKSQPIIIMVEEPIDLFWKGWLFDNKNYIIIASVLVVLIPLLMLAVWRNIQSQEQSRVAMEKAQLQISQSERDLQLLMRSVQEFIFRTDINGYLIFSNARWDVFPFFKIQDESRYRLADVVDADFTEKVDRLFDVFSDDGLRNCQAWVTFEGVPFALEIAVVPLVVGDEIKGFAGSVFNVTEKWHAEQNLQSQLAFQNLLLEMSPLPMSLTDCSNNLILVNKAWEEYKGKNRATVVGHHLKEVLPTNEFQAHSEYNNKILENEGSVHFEIKVKHGDGFLHDTRIIKAVVPGAQGKPQGILNILMDVSEFREAERATQKAKDAMTEAFRVKSEFVANMSHELRTPLQSIMGFAELGVLRGGKEPKLQVMFEDIYAAGQRMLTLVNDLLDVAKIESAIGTINLEKTDLRIIINSTIDELRPLFAKNNLHHSVQIIDKPLICKVDPIRFQQVIRNIVANAIKFAPDGTSIDISADIDGDGSAHIVVRDHGPGIPEAELVSIFEAFVQSSTTKDGSGGTGLGLAICKKIMDALSGEIYAENSKSGGAEFHIVLAVENQDLVEIIGG